jgi:glycine/D-amino acid oxidase-like deaminating enzyme
MGVQDWLQPGLAARSMIPVFRLRSIKAPWRKACMVGIRLGTTGDGMATNLKELSKHVFWMHGSDYEPNPPLTGDARTDVVIVGGGFTGLWSAYLLLEEDPARKVVILEGNQVGYGASGRNGGFVMTLVHHSLESLAELTGDDGARSIHAAAMRSVDHVSSVIREEAIDCDPMPSGLLMVSGSPPEDARIEATVAAAERLGFSNVIRYLSRDEAQAEIRSERIRCGLAEEPCTLVNPAKLAWGLKRVVERMGARVHEDTRVIGWKEASSGVVVSTDHGNVSADRAVIGGNAYGHAWRPTRDHVNTFYTYICLTRPLDDDEWSSVGWAGRQGVEDRRRGLHYFRPTTDGRILWGGREVVFSPRGPKPKHDVDDGVRVRLRETFEEFFPQLRHVPFEHHWGGPIGITSHFLPVVGFSNDKVRRVAHAYGYNGHGMAITNLAAHAVRDLLADRESEWTDLYFVGRRPPLAGPRPVRNRLIKRISRATRKADDEGRTKEPLLLRMLNAFNRS